MPASRDRAPPIGRGGVDVIRITRGKPTDVLPSSCESPARSITFRRCLPPAILAWPRLVVILSHERPFVGSFCFGWSSVVLSATVVGQAATDLLPSKIPTSPFRSRSFGLTVVSRRAGPYLCLRLLNIFTATASHDVVLVRWLGRAKAERCAQERHPAAAGAAGHAAEEGKAFAGSDG